MTYRGTIDEDKQIVLARPLSAMDKKLIRVAYVNPELRATAIRIVVADDSSKLKEFAADRKWKNPETTHLIGFDRVLQLAGEDKMWAKAIVKKVTEEYKKSDEGKKEEEGAASKGISKKLQKDVENEIAKFKSKGKDITNPKDRAAFEEYLDEKLRPAQEEAYRKKIKEVTGMNKEEMSKATKGLTSKGIKETFENIGGVEIGLLGFGGIGTVLGGAAISAAATAAGSLAGGVAAVGLGTLLAPVVGVGAAIAGMAKLYQTYKKQPSIEEKDKIIKKFNEKKEEAISKIEREHKYKELGKEEGVRDGLKNFFKDEKFEDEILGDDLTIEELYKISDDDDADPEDKKRAEELLEEKKKDYMASKYTRQKTLLSETKGKKFKTPEGKRVTVKEMLDMEEEGDSWATDKLKDLRHSIEGVEEVEEKEEEKEKEEDSSSDDFEEELFQNRDVDISQLTNLRTRRQLEQNIVRLSPEALNRLQERIIDQAGNRPTRTRYEEFDDDDDDRSSRGRNVKPKEKPKRVMRVEEDDKPVIPASDAKVLLEAMGKIRKENESLESKFKNEKFKTPQDKTITFKTLKKKFSDTEDADHEWAVKTWEGLKKKMNKKGAEKKDQDKEINNIVKEKFESALTVDPDVIEIFKSMTTDGKFDEKKLDAMVKELKDFGEILKGKESKKEEKTSKKASLDVSANRNSLIKLAYNNPELRRDILKLLK